MAALGPYVPIEAWPEATREAIADAYTIRAASAAERIREQVRAARCSCRLPGPVALEGRCLRCYSLRSEEVR